MLTVYIHNGCILDPHNSKILAGLSYLFAQQRINLKISKSHFSEKINKLSLDRFTFWVWVEDGESGQSRHICFDVQDGAGYSYPELLQACDVYFKRSYRQEFIEKLPLSLQKKIRPFGLNYACCSPYFNFDFRLRLSSLLAGRKKSESDSEFKQIRRLLVSFMRRWYPNFMTSNSFYHPPISTLFELNPGGAVPLKIIFQTRAWDPSISTFQSQTTLKQLNDSRAEIIRALRRTYGDAVVAGFSADSFSAKYYPDCISTQRTNKTAYMKLVRDSTICVQTTGIYGSSGWKLAEYFAAGKCIVTEPILDTLPVPLENGRNILTFTDPDQCISSCRYLLENPEIATKMSNDNFLY